ncbi:MAG TPA: sigma-70 family RNA polymerase sigma factor [Oscillospiraceae bacterium]|nr:sigma-70 family RNA polymerase sigma factor [Oscillospiraceae bacterium]
MSRLPEREKILVRRCQAGDLLAFDQLMQRYEKKVYALCYRMSGNPEDTADLAQEAFLKAFRALPLFKGQAQFSTWLYRIAANTCLDEQRKRKKYQPMLSLDQPISTKDGELQRQIPDDAPDPLTATIRRELQFEIQTLLTQLPPAQRAVLALRDLDGFSYEEIAAILQVKMGTLKSRLNRARASLRELYLQKEEQIQPEHIQQRKGAKK